MSLAEERLDSTAGTFLKEQVFSCQSTNLLKATSHLPIWDVRQYLWDMKSGIYTPFGRIHALLKSLNIKTRTLLTGKSYITVHGSLKRTPSATLNLQPGELVEVRSKQEIIATLDYRGRNRGLEFTPEMLKYCGGRYRVFMRLERMINENTGMMREIANTVILEGVTCDGSAHGGCQRTCFCFWREIWLKRVEPSQNLPQKS